MAEHQPGTAASDDHFEFADQVSAVMERSTSQPTDSPGVVDDGHDLEGSAVGEASTRSPPPFLLAPHDLGVVSVVLVPRRLLRRRCGTPHCVFTLEALLLLAVPVQPSPRASP